MSKREHKPDRKERRENLLRPSPYLGYDRDTLAMYLVEREAYGLAESQLRRAIWLNPFEPRFKVHLAWCFYKEGRDGDARTCLAEVPDVDVRGRLRTMADLIRQGRTEDATEENR